MSRHNTPRLGASAPQAGNRSRNFLERRLGRLGDPLPEKTHAQIVFSDPAPPDVIVAAVIISPIGLSGHIRARPTADSRRISPEKISKTAICPIAEVGRVWLQNPSGWRATKILSSSPRGDHFCLELACSSDRTTAEGLIGTRICISRPQESEDLYWSDLIGKPVENTSGILLGTVSRLETNGEHDWLVVGPHFIPLVNRHVLSLGKKGSPIVVDWNEDWSQ